MLAFTKSEAGTYKKGVSSECWTLAPLPIPSNYPTIPQQINLKKATQTYLDYSRSDLWGFEFIIRACIGVCFMLFCAFLLGHCFFLWVSFKYYPHLFYQEFIRIGYGMMPFYLVGVGGMLLFYAVSILHITLVKNNETPIRFNREKREVGIVLDKKLIIFPWESIGVQVENKLLTTSYAMTTFSALNLFIPKSDDNPRGIYFSRNYPVDSLAIAEWETIRVFMEEGLDSLQSHIGKVTLSEIPQPVDISSINTEDGYDQLLDKYPEGSPEYFYTLKAKNKFLKNGYKWWCFIHFCSGWTLPCYIAKWLNKYANTRTPKALNEWSKPIPAEEWAKPSQKLIEQSKKLTFAYNNGVVNFQEYFKKRSRYNR